MLLIRALLEIIYVDHLFRRGFRPVHDAVRRTARAARQTRPVDPARVVAAVDAASALYVRPLYCLQRAAAITRLLRRDGVDAHLIIGCRPRPVEAHAWVEVGGVVVAENEPDIAHYRVLDVL